MNACAKRLNSEKPHFFLGRSAIALNRLRHRNDPRDISQPGNPALLDSLRIGGFHLALPMSLASADFARITIDYRPAKRCIETKSLKFYLASYRNERAFNEAVTNHDPRRPVRVCAPGK